MGSKKKSRQRYSHYQKMRDSGVHGDHYTFCEYLMDYARGSGKGCKTPKKPTRQPYSKAEIRHMKANDLFLKRQKEKKKDEYFRKLNKRMSAKQKKTRGDKIPF